MTEDGLRVIAILADYPYWIYMEDMGNEGRHPSPWLASVQKSIADVADSSHLFKNYEFHWVTLTKAVKKERTVKVDGQYMHLLPSGSKMLSQFLRYWPDRLTVRRALKRIKPDLVHVWGSESAYGLCVKDFGGKKLFSLQGMLTAYVQRAQMGAFTERQSRFEKEIFEAMPVITTESEWARERVLELVPEADVRLWEYAAEERFFNVERKITPEPTCLIAGTNAQYKNVSLAIKAFSRPELRHIKLYMAGISPASYPDLPENIIPLGFVSRETIVTLLQETWCLVHPSLADCCPNIVKEARTIGVPCVVTEECGAKQYIVQGKSGYIIAPHNEQQLVDSVLSMTKDAATSVAMGEYDRERCRQALSQKTMSLGLAALYDELLNES